MLFRSPQEKREDYRFILSKLSDPPSIEFSKEALKSFKKQAFEDRIEKLLQESSAIEQIKEEIREFEKSDLDLVKNTKVDGSLEHLREMSNPLNGIQWHTPSLREAMPPINQGIFGVVAARPGRGKSSMLASFCANAVKQDKLVNTKKPIIWLNNENAGWRACYQRFYCAFFEKRWDEILKEFEFYSEEVERLKLPSRVICHDIQGRNYQDIESFISYYDPSLVILDMIDNIHGFDIKGNETSNTKYERMYQWGLEVSSTKCPILASSQLNKSAEGWDFQGNFVAEDSHYRREIGRASCRERV